MRVRWAAFLAWTVRHPQVTDLSVAVFLAVLAVGSARLTVDVVGGSFALSATLAAIAALSLAARRKAPLVVLLITSAVVLATLTVESMMEVNISSVAVLVALYSAGAYGRAPWRDRVRWVCLLAIATVGLWFVLVTDIPEEFGSTVRVSLFRAFTIALNVVYFAIGWRLGDVVRERRERGAELEERNRQLAHERDENARRAVLDERVRIARDLHDVVAHHVSVMGVQAGAARRVLDKRPDLAAEALGQIEASSREAVAELQRLLGFLRSRAEQEAGESSPGPVAAPQPSLDRLPDLVAGVAAELPVALVCTGDVRPLPSTVELSAYRVVQEALTNCLKHAGVGARAEVLVHYLQHELVVDVLDDGRGASVAATGGHGLVGMRERVLLHGGEFRAGPRPGGGFQVRAVFPLRLRAQVAS